MNEVKQQENKCGYRDVLSLDEAKKTSNPRVKEVVELLEDEKTIQRIAIYSEVHSVYERGGGTW